MTARLSIGRRCRQALAGGLRTATASAARWGVIALLRSLRTRLPIWLSVIACAMLFIPVAYLGRSEVRDLLLICIAVSALSSLTASGVFTAYFSRESAASRTLIRFSLTALFVAGLIVPLTQMAEWQLSAAEFLTSLKVTADPRLPGVGVSEQMSSRIYGVDSQASTRGSEFLFADHARLRERVLTEPLPELITEHAAFLEASLLAALEAATRPHWFRPVDFAVGPAAFAARYRYSVEAQAESLVTGRELAENLKGNPFLRQIAISLPPGTSLVVTRRSPTATGGAILLEQRTFYLAMTFESLACRVEPDIEAEYVRVLTEMVLSGKPFPESVSLDSATLPRGVHCTGQVRLNGGTKRLWNWTAQAARYRQWIEYVARRVQFLLEAPRLTLGDLEERRFEGLLNLRMMNQLNLLERRLTQPEATGHQRPAAAQR